MRRAVFGLNQPLWQQICVKIFYLNPCFQFAKILNDINNIVTARFDLQSFNWVLSTAHFEYKHMFQTNEGEIAMTRQKFCVESMVDTLKTYFYLMAAMYLSGSYLDNVLQQNRGVPRPWYFPFQIQFWLPFLRRSGKSGSMIIDSE